MTEPKQPCTEGHQQTLTQSDCVLTHGAHPDGCTRMKAAKVGYLCVWHRERLDTVTQDVSNLWLDLALILEAGSAPSEAVVTRGGKGEPPAPANLEALSLRDPRSSSVGDIPSVPSIVASWVLMYAEERPLTAVLPSSVVAQLDLLTTHHEWACSQPWIDDYWRELDELRRALKHCLRDRELPELGRCLDDDTNLVDDSTGGAKCPKCGRGWSTAQELARLKVGQRKGAA